MGVKGVGLLAWSVGVRVWDFGLSVGAWLRDLTPGMGLDVSHVRIWAVGKSRDGQQKGDRCRELRTCHLGFCTVPPFRARNQ